MNIHSDTLILFWHKILSLRLRIMSRIYVSCTSAPSAFAIFLSLSLPFSVTLFSSTVAWILKETDSGAASHGSTVVRYEDPASVTKIKYESDESDGACELTGPHDQRERKRLIMLLIKAAGIHRLILKYSRGFVEYFRMLK